VQNNGPLTTNVEKKHTELQEFTMHLILYEEIPYNNYLLGFPILWVRKIQKIYKIFIHIDCI
jgi:hypothetical protein